MPLPELADRHRRRPAVRAVPAQGAAAVGHRQGDRPGHRAAGVLLGAAAAGADRRGRRSRRRPRRAARRGAHGEGRQAPGRRTALEEATALDPKLAAAHLMLAPAYEEAKDYDKAIERYRRCWRSTRTTRSRSTTSPTRWPCRKGQPAEALRYAERAMTLTRGQQPRVADTLAWVQHLLGRDREAAQTARARREGGAGPGARSGCTPRSSTRRSGGSEAAAELAEAVRLDPSLETNADVKALRTKLQARRSLV